MSYIDPDFLDQKYLVDPYANWAKAQGAPIVEGYSLDLFSVATGPFARFGVDGAICHLEGRCDFLTAVLLDIPPGGASKPARHMFEDCFYVLAGQGVAEIELSDGSRHDIAWEPGRLFAPPVNARFVLRNRGAERARLIGFNDLRYLMGLYRNEAFLFENTGAFTRRQAAALHAGLVVDLVGGRQAGNDPEPQPLRLADLSLGADLAILPAGGHGAARRQMQGRHTLCVGGTGFTLSYASPDAEVVRTDWKPGVLCGLPGMTFHQHFNPGGDPLRLLGVELGSMSSPMFRSRRANFGDTEVYASGAAEIAEADMPGRVAEIWRAACANV